MTAATLVYTLLEDEHDDPKDVAASLNPVEMVFDWLDQNMVRQDTPDPTWVGDFRSHDNDGTKRRYLTVWKHRTSRHAAFYLYVGDDCTRFDADESYDLIRKLSNETRGLTLNRAWSR